MEPPLPAVSLLPFASSIPPLLTSRREPASSATVEAVREMLPPSAGRSGWPRPSSESFVNRPATSMIAAGPSRIASATAGSPTGWYVPEAGS